MSDLKNHPTWQANKLPGGFWFWIGFCQVGENHGVSVGLGMEISDEVPFRPWPQIFSKTSQRRGSVILTLSFFGLILTVQTLDLRVSAGGSDV